MSVYDTISSGDRMEWYEKLRMYRESAGYTQKQLAEQLHMTQRKISRMETGQAEPSINDLVLLCQFFHVSADYLLGLTHDPRPDPRKKDR